MEGLFPSESYENKAALENTYALATKVLLKGMGIWIKPLCLQVKKEHSFSPRASVQSPG